MEKILLLGINARFTHTNLAIRYLRNYVVELPYQTVIKEVTIKQTPFAILQEIWKINPQILAISVYIWNVEIVKVLLPDIKKVLPKVILLLGGPEVSFNGSDWLRNYPEIDYIIAGFGETGFKYFLENRKILTEKIIKISNPHFSEIPFPYRDEDFPEINDKYVYYEASRGCAFRCSYCLSSRNDQKLEFRKITDVKNELNFLLSKKVKIIKFIDRTFNSNSQFSREIWKFLSNLETQTKFHFEIHPSFLQEEDFSILKKIKPGIFQFEIGIQSVNPKAISAIHRKDDWQKSKKNIFRLVKMANIHLHVDLIVGLPYDTFSEIINSFNEIFELQAHHFQLGFLKILTGTPLQEEKDKFGILYSESAPYQVLQTKWLNYEEIILLQKIEKLLNIYYNSEKFVRTLKELVTEFEHPFAFFRELLGFFEDNHFDFIIKNWQKNAFHLLKFIQSKLPDRSGFFIDCLRYDWCKIAGSHYYPDFIRSSEIDDFRRKNYLLIKQKIEEKNSHFGLQLKKAVFFKPLTEEFKKKYPEEKNITIFFPNGKKLIL